MNFSLIFLVFILGLVFGSFTNVIIYRLPAQLSLCKPPSSCTKCNYQIKWFDNIPLISYIILGGKCRKCLANISLLYPIIELLTGFTFIILLFNSHSILHFTWMALLSILFISMCVIDYKYFILPDKILITGAVISLGYYCYVYNFMIVNNLISSTIVFVVLYFIQISSLKLFKKESFGSGDIKLGALIGFLMGWEDALIAIFFGFVIAAILLIILFFFRKITSHSYIPFGPFIVAGMLTYLFLGEQIVDYYLRFYTGY